MLMSFLVKNFENCEFLPIGTTIIKGKIIHFRNMNEKIDLISNANTIKKIALSIRIDILVGQSTQRDMQIWLKMIFALQLREM